MSQIDWLSHLLHIMGATHQLRVRCTCGGPLPEAWHRSTAYEIPYHIVVKGRAIIKDQESGTATELLAGDAVLLPSGTADVVNHGSGQAPGCDDDRRTVEGSTINGNDGHGEQLHMLCGRFIIGSPHDRLIRNYLPKNLVVRSSHSDGRDANGSMSNLATLVGLMRIESLSSRLGGHAVLDAFTSALFGLMLRTAIESEQAPVGLLKLLGQPRLAPAISAMFVEPARSWKLRDLAGLCGMSRDTFMRHVHGKLGRSPVGLLTDIRMSLAANALKKRVTTAEAVAELVGYQSVSAFRRVFAERVGMTPGQWRRLARDGG